MFRFAEDHRRDLVAFIDGRGGDGEDEVAVMERFEQEGLDNAHRVRDGWCTCAKVEVELYYRRENGRHGWFCAACGGITQTG